MPNYVTKFIHESQARLRRQQEYTQGILETTEHPCNITITVVGHKGVGKSCLVKQLKQEHIPKGGPGSTDTADFYIDYIAYNPDTGFRKTLDENGEIETRQHRLKMLIDKFRKSKNDRRNEADRRKEMETVDHQQIQNEYLKALEENTLHQTETYADKQTDPEPLHQTEKQTDPEPLHQTEKQTDPEPLHQTEKHTDPEPLHQTEKHTDPEPPHQTEKHTDPEPLHQTEKQTDHEPPYQTEKRTDPEPSHQTEKHTDLEPPNQTEKQRDREPSHQYEKQTDREPPHQTEKHTDPEPPHQTEKQKHPEPLHQTENQTNAEPLHQSETRNQFTENTVPAQVSPRTPSPQPSTSKRHKTASLVEESYAKKEVQQTSQHISREQRQVIEQIMKTKTKEGKEEVKGFVTIYDFGGERVFYNTHHCFMSSNMVFVLVFDVDMCLDKDRSTAGYDIIEHWLKSIATYALDDESRGEGIPPIILIGSHLDMVSPDMLQRRLRSQYLTHVAHSVIDFFGKQVIILNDFILKKYMKLKLPNGGNDVKSKKQTTRKEFKKRINQDDGVGHVVFKKETQEQMFVDVLEKLQDNQQLRKIMEDHVQEMFAMANLNDSTVNKDVYEALWQKIIGIAHLQSQWKKSVPSRWIAMEHELIRLKNKGNILLKYDELLDVNCKLVVPLTEEEIRDFLRYLKYAGRLLCFNLYTQFPFIVIQPQWVINAFKQIITDEKFKKAMTKKMKLEWRKYTKTGVLPMSFLKQLWSEDTFLDNEEELLVVMETLNLLALPIPLDQNDKVNYYIVPSMLPTAAPELIGRVLKDPNIVITVTLCLTFNKKFIPQAVWDKMIASCIHRFQRLNEPKHDGLKFIQRGFACLEVNVQWNMILNCRDNAIKITMFKRDTDHSTPKGTGVKLLTILEFLLRRILELNHQSHLGYQYYLHNDYRFSINDKMVKVDDLRQIQRFQCFGSKGVSWITTNELNVWFECKATEAGNEDMRGSEIASTDLYTPDRELTLIEIGRLSAYIGIPYHMFFVELDCPMTLLEQLMEENRHLAFRSRITKVLVCLQRTKRRFSTVASAMSKNGMDTSKLQSIIESNRIYDFKDDTQLETTLCVKDAPSIATYVGIKMYFNLFLELGFSPENIDDFDVRFPHSRSRKKVEAMLTSLIKKTKPAATIGTIIKAMRECQMDTHDVLKALLQNHETKQHSSSICLIA